LPASAPRKYIVEAGCPSSGLIHIVIVKLPSNSVAKVLPVFK